MTAQTASTQEISADPVMTILVVDDEQANIRLIAEVFDELYELRFAMSGQAALDVAVRERPDLILLDVIMPDIDGFEVCRRIKANPVTADIPVIFITAQIDPGKEIEGLDIGAVDYITKPINPAVVQARVRTHLNLVRAMKRVNELNSTLEHRVSLRSAELEKAMGALARSQTELARSEARATLSTLIASVSHELQTPIGNSVLTSGMLTKRASHLLEMVETGQLKRSELNLFLSDLRSGTDLLTRNLHRARDLLVNFKQVAADQASEQRRRFDLATAVNEVIATLGPSLKTKPHKIEVSIPPAIVMDSLPGPLGQVVINLINNAYMHAFEGRSEGLLKISGTLDGSMVRLVVEDNGVGMTPESLGRLFEPFFSTKIGQGGTGLGMSIVDNLVRKSLGGSIHVSSSPGQGTRYDVDLPLEAPGKAVG